jgi:DNA-binding transcriptional MerR regulator
MPEARYDLKTLCLEAEVTPRTVHFYIQAGLLRPAGTPGPGSHYNKGHLKRLQLIKLLQKEHLPLAEIRKRIDSLDDAEVERVLGEYQSRRASAQTTAVDYIRSVLSGQPRQYFSAAMEPSATTRPSIPQNVRPAPERSQWERILLATDIELHLRRPLSREQNRQVERLIAFARELFKEEMP